MLCGLPPKNGLGLMIPGFVVVGSHCCSKPNNEANMLVCSLGHHYLKQIWPIIRFRFFRSMIGFTASNHSSSAKNIFRWFGCFPIIPVLPQGSPDGTHLHRNWEGRYGLSHPLLWKRVGPKKARQMEIIVIHKSCFKKQHCLRVRTMFVYFPLLPASPKEASPGSESRFRHLVMNACRKTVNQIALVNKTNIE